MRRFSSLFALCGLIALFGFGCKKDPIIQRTISPINPPIQANATSTPAAKPKIPPTSSSTGSVTPAPEIAYLRQVLRNLLQTRSFRASLSLPTDLGLSTGEIEYVRETGLHGLLHLPNNTTSEVYLLGTSVYFRTGTSTWVDLGAKVEGKQAADLFRSSFALNESSINASISNSAKVTDTINDPSGCRRYTLLQSTVDGGTQTSYLCVQNDLPVLIQSPGQYGTIEVRYRDFNANIPLHSPVP